jgi:hypothetical protein
MPKFFQNRSTERGPPEFTISSTFQTIFINLNQLAKHDAPPGQRRQMQLRRGKLMRRRPWQAFSYGVTKIVFCFFLNPVHEPPVPGSYFISLH